MADPAHGRALNEIAEEIVGPGFFNARMVRRARDREVDEVRSTVTELVDVELCTLLALRIGLPSTLVIATFCSGDAKSARCSGRDVRSRLGEGTEVGSALGRVAGGASFPLGLSILFDIEAGLILR